MCPLQKSLNLTNFYLLIFSIFFVSLPVQVVTGEAGQAQSLQDNKTDEDRRLASCRNHIKNQQFQEALQACQKVALDFKAISNPSGEWKALNNVGVTYNSLGQYQKGIEFFQQSLAISRRIADRNGEGKSLNNLGSAHNSLGQYQMAIDFYRQSLSISSQIGDRREEGNLLINLGNAYNFLRQYAEAWDLYQQALKVKREIGDRKGEGMVLFNLGNVYYSLGQTDKAIDFYQQALTIFKEVGDRNAEGKVLNDLGSVYFYLSQYTKAIKVSQQALAIFKEIGDRDGEGSSLTGLHNAYFNLGDYGKVLEISEKGLVLSKEIGDRNGVRASLNWLGAFYNIIGQYSKAIEFYEQALKISQERGNLNEGTSITLAGLGNAYNSLEQYSKAIEFYQQALKNSQKRGDQGYIWLIHLASVYNTTGQYAKAVEFYQQALKNSQKRGDLPWAVSSLNGLGNVYSNLRQYQEAIDFYQQSLAISKQIGTRSAEGSTHSNLATTFKALNQPELAIIFYKQSVNVSETIRKDIRGLNTEEQQSYRNTVTKGYQSLADRLLQKGRVMEALQVLDLLKVQDLQDFLKDVKGNERTALGVEMLLQEQKFLDEFNTIQDRAVKLGDELTELRKLQPLTPSQQQRLNEIEQIQQQVNQQLIAHLQSDSTKALIAQLQQTAAKQNTNLNAYKDLSVRVQRLGQGTALFYPLILDNRIELVLFIPNQPPIHRSVNIKQTELEAEIKTFRQQLEARNPNIETTANQLYKKLIAPIEPDLKAAKIQTIVYAPDGQMRYVPLAALHDGKQWLVERYLINNVTAVSLTNLDPNPNQQSQVLAGAFEKGKYSFTVNDKSYNFNGLPFAGKEVTDLAQTIPNTVKLVDNEFSRAKVLPNMKTSNIIHLATHAAFVEGSPDNSFILLGNGDRINLREVSEWDLPNVTLVVLSACQTALGGNLGNGIEILGFGYQLQRAKVRAAIASLWTVSDGGTQQSMSAFYTAIKTGKVSHAEALRQAQVALITGDYEALGEPRGEFVSVEPRSRAKPSSAPTKLTHPYYWAPFIMIGNGL